MPIVTGIAAPPVVGDPSWLAHSTAARPHVPLGSLTQPGARAGAGCRACGSERVTRIAMSLTDGSPVAVHLLPPLRAPHLGGAGRRERVAVLPVDRVLDKTRKIV